MDTLETYQPSPLTSPTGKLGSIYAPRLGWRLPSLLQKARRTSTDPHCLSPCPPRQMDEHLSGVSTRCDERSFPTAEYRQTARRMAEYRLVGGGMAEYRQPAGGLARGGSGGERAMRGGRGGICDKKVGFVCSLTDRAGLSPLFSRSESPSAARGAGDGLGFPDG
jgi:hypothetical protein